MSYKILLKIIGCVCFVMMLASCKKVTEIPVPAQAQNRILSYKITNVQGDPIEGVVNDDEETVKVYLPYYYYLTAIEPEIKVSEGASVTPVSGTLIDDLLDVFDNGRDISYTVTAKDGTKASYKLQIIVQQGDVHVDELSPNETELTEYVYGTVNGTAYLSFAISGDVPSGNKELDRQLIKITLIAADGSEYVLDNNRGAKLDVSPNYVSFLFDRTSVPGLTAGIYHVKFRFYSKTVSLKNPIKITITNQ